MTAAGDGEMEEQLEENDAAYNNPTMKIIRGYIMYDHRRI
jgi:hypothetical protein